MGTLVRGPIGRQEAGAAECHPHLLKHIPYEDAQREKVKLPERQKPHGYKASDYPFKFVPELTWPAG